MVSSSASMQKLSHGVRSTMTICSLNLERGALHRRLSSTGTADIGRALHLGLWHTVRASRYAPPVSPLRAVCAGQVRHIGPPASRESSLKRPGQPWWRLLRSGPYWLRIRDRDTLLDWLQQWSSSSGVATTADSSLRNMVPRSVG